MSSAEFADFILERTGVTLVPGTCFGKHGEGYVRLSFTKRPEIIDAACKEMKDAISEFTSGTSVRQGRVG